jgi:hypothetical protein
VTLLDLIDGLKAPDPHPALVERVTPAPAEVMKAAFVLGGLYPDVSYLGVVR